MKKYIILNNDIESSLSLTFKKNNIEDTKYSLPIKFLTALKKLSLLSSVVLITNVLLVVIKETISKSEYFKKNISNLRYNYNQYFLHENPDKIITCDVRKEYIQAIASGKKTYEGRINKESFKKYTPGKIVIWRNESDYVVTQIVSRRVFKSFEQMLTKINFKLFIPEAKNKEEAKKVYDNIPGYAENVKKYGALALGLKLKPKL